MNRKNWRLDEWSEIYRREMDIHDNLPKMEKDDIKEAIEWLRENRYQKPEDCPGGRCFQYRPACNIGTCVIAVKMCGDF